MLAAAVGVFWFHLALQPVLSPSMRPTFDPGAAIISRSVPASDVRPGDVIVFRPPNRAAQYAHRIATVSGDPRHPAITTKGDANPAPDPWKFQLSAGSVPVVIASVPWVGRVMVALGGAGPRVGLAIFAGLVFFVVGTRSILAPRSPRPVRARHAHAG